MFKSPNRLRVTGQSQDGSSYVDASYEGLDPLDQDDGLNFKFPAASLDDGAGSGSGGGASGSGASVIVSIGSGLVFNNTYAASCSASFEACIVAAPGAPLFERHCA